MPVDTTESYPAFGCRQFKLHLNTNHILYFAGTWKLKPYRSLDCITFLRRKLNKSTGLNVLFQIRILLFMQWRFRPA